MLPDNQPDNNCNIHR